jgi:hypothetical protein
LIQVKVNRAASAYRLTRIIRAFNFDAGQATAEGTSHRPGRKMAIASRVSVRQVSISEHERPARERERSPAMKSGAAHAPPPARTSE